MLGDDVVTKFEEFHREIATRENTEEMVKEGGFQAVSLLPVGSALRAANFGYKGLAVAAAHKTGEKITLSYLKERLNRALGEGLALGKKISI